MAGFRGASEPYALLLARRLRERFGATWGLAETGAAGPSGNSYGDAPGMAASRSRGRSSGFAHIETGSDDRRWQYARSSAATALGEKL
jgi:nicotinamide-nucleotide amidase